MTCPATRRHGASRWALFAAGISGLIVAVLIATLVAEPTRTPGAAKPGLAEWLRVVRVPGLWLCFFGAICFITFVIAFSIFAPLYVPSVHHLSGTASASASGLGGFAYSPAGRALSNRLGRRPMLLLAAAACAALPLVLIAAVGAPPSLLALAAVLLTAASAVAATLGPILAGLAGDRVGPAAPLLVCCAAACGIFFTRTAQALPDGFRTVS